VTENGGVLKDYSADHVSVPEARALFQTLNEAFAEFPVKFYPGMGTGYRNLMILSTPKASTAHAKLAPPHDIMGGRVEEYLPREAEEPVLRTLMVESKRLLEAHPVNIAREREGKGKANMIWLWGQGRSPKWPTYRERFGKRGAVITAVDLVKGIGIYAGLDVISVPGVTGYFDTNYEGKAEYALAALKIRDLAVIHVESTDEAGHMGELKLKVKAIEDIDRRLLGPLMKGLEKAGEHRLLVVPDHYTCLETRTHAMDPVPYMIYSSREAMEGAPKFCERTAAKSRQPLRKGHELIELFLRED
jgi:2,3-bisphosphoglycerate-independent phosphoglycerate mutase